MDSLGAMANNASHLTALSVGGEFVLKMSALLFVGEFHLLLIEKQRSLSQEQTRHPLLLLVRGLRGQRGGERCRWLVSGSRLGSMAANILQIQFPKQC